MNKQDTQNANNIQEMHNVQYAWTVLKRSSREKLYEGQGDCLSKVHSDQIVLGTVRLAGWTA
jgi:hypothetical protein